MYTRHTEEERRTEYQQASSKDRKEKEKRKKKKKKRRKKEEKKEKKKTFRSLDDLSEGPHESTIDTHQLLTSNHIGLVQHNTDLLVVALKTKREKK